jgi:hypothetical protein
MEPREILSFGFGFPITFLIHLMSEQVAEMDQSRLSLAITSTEFTFMIVFTFMLRNANMNATDILSSFVSRAPPPGTRPGRHA